MEYNSAEFFNKLFQESENKGYNANYTKVNNNSYNTNKKKSSNSTAKTLTYIIAGGVIIYYAYKNVLKPAAKVVNNILNLFDTSSSSNDERFSSYKNYANNTSDHILNGQVTRLSPREASRIKRDSNTSVAYEDPFHVGCYRIVDEKIHYQNH